MVEFSKEDLAFLAAGVLAQAYITPRLPELPEGGLTSALNDPTTQSLLIIGVVFLALHSAWEFGRDLLSKNDDSSASIGITTISGPPSNVLYNAAIRYRGVDWDGQFGTTRGNESSYVEGPYCPRCETELSMQNKTRRVRSKQKLWKCPSCGFSTSRETDTRDTQRDMVEKIIENEADDAMTNILAGDDPEIEEAMNEILNRAVEQEPDVEEFIENPSRQAYDEDVKNAVFDAIDEEVGNEEIRGNPALRVVLRKRFDYSLPDDGRNYEIMDEHLNERRIRRRYRNR